MATSELNVTARPFHCQVLRVLLAGFALLLVGSTSLLIGHTSADGIVFGLWSLGYFALILSFVIPGIFLILFILIAPDRVLQSLLHTVVWLRRKPLIIIVATLLLIEGLSFIHSELIRLAILDSSRPTIFGGNFLIYGRTTIFIQCLVFLALYLGFILMVAGRQLGEIGPLLRRTGICLLAATMGAGVTALFYAYVIDADNYRSRHIATTELLEPDDTLVYRHKPNLHNLALYFDHERGTFVASTNSSGFRGTHEIQDTPVGMLGDSTVFGWGVNNDQLWSAALEKDLGISVTNYGVLGYYWWQYNAVAEQYAPSAHHQVLLYGLNATDMINDASMAKSLDLIQYWQLWPYRSPFHYTFSVLADSTPGHRLWPTIRDSVVPSNTDEPVQSTSCVILPAALGNDDLDIVKQHVNESIRLAEQGGYRAVFLTIPFSAGMYASQPPNECILKDEEGRLLSEAAAFDFTCTYIQEQGALCYDMTKDLREIGKTIGADDFFPPDSHWSPLGHATIAHLIAEYIRTHDLLSR